MSLINIFDYEREAANRIPESFFGYYAGGAADELTLRDNREAFNRLKLVPRVLVDVSRRSASTTIMGSQSALPVVIAPTAMAKMAHADAECGIAAAAKRMGVVQCISTLSNDSMEDIRSVGAMNWFQLYVYRDRSITEALVERAAASGCTAIVLTVDVPVAGVRENIMRTGLQLPTGMALHNFDGIHDTDAATFLPYLDEQFDPSLSWDDLKWLVSITSLPVLVKGVLRPDDAQRAVDCGAGGIIVSNHGGRQLDTAIAGIDALPGVVDAVGATTEVLVDGGVRRGTDIIKALALGARAVMLGRPVVWGLAVDGGNGVDAVLSILARELDTAMALCGCPDVADIDRTLVGERMRDEG